MRAFLEKVEGDYMDDFVFISKYQLRNLGIDVIDFNGLDLDSFFNQYKNDFDLKNDIMIGSVEATSRFFTNCGIEIPKYLGYPDELKNHLHRNIIETKFGEINHPYPYFIKPSTHVKLFTGSLVESEKSYNFMRDFYKEINADTQVYLSSPIEFISEYRCFVHKGELKGIQWYAGDFKVFPDVDTIQNMVNDFKNCPVSYTLDVGVTRLKDELGYAEHQGFIHQTVLVEINDLWAVGSYGFNSKDYVRMTIDRFQEINKTAQVLNDNR